MISKTSVVASLLTVLASAAPACEEITFDDIPFTICRANAANDEMRLFLYDEDDTPLSTFGRVDDTLEAEGKSLRFAMNAGMYHDDRAPVGHYIENGREIMRVIPNAGPGNFGLLPNGVFCIRDGRADVIETLRYLDDRPACDYASQSGPMLVIDGALHPRFLADGTSRYVRNGVGTSNDGQTVVFAISDVPVTFHEFGRLFRDELGLPQALFFDGNVSRLYDAQSGRSDFGRAMGPIVGVLEPAG